MTDEALMDNAGGEDLIFRALTDPTRRAVLALLGREGSLSVSDISSHFPSVGRTAISAHLRVLKAAGLVDERRDGRHRLYSLGSDQVSAAIEYLRQVYQGSLALPEQTTPDRPRGRGRPAQVVPLAAAQQGIRRIG
jgi:DNA-binding transcriptional ArsR family regulator